MKKSEKIIVSNQIECLKCGDRPFSAYLHDFKWCRCGAVAVDGGVDYLRRCGNVKNYKDLSIVEDKLCIQRIVDQAEEMQRTGRNIRGVVYGVLRQLRDEGLLKGKGDSTVEGVR